MIATHYFGVFILIIIKRRQGSITLSLVWGWVSLPGCLPRCLLRWSVAECLTGGLFRWSVAETGTCWGGQLLRQGPVEVVSCWDRGPLRGSVTETGTCWGGQLLSTWQGPVEVVSYWDRGLLRQSVTETAACWGGQLLSTWQEPVEVAGCGVLDKGLVQKKMGALEQFRQF